MQIKSVAVLGAGAVGSYVIWGLSSRKDIRLAVIAEGPRAERLKQQGITINGTTYRPQVWTPQEANGVDLLVVALKYGALPGALDSIAAAVGPNTTVMSLMNGVDSEEIIAAKIGAEHVLPSLINPSASLLQRQPVWRPRSPPGGVLCAPDPWSSPTAGKRPSHRDLCIAAG